ncbi:MAG: hypothetical protein L0Y54_09740 [Sporichthyaceae bacterium]|nr:hypothetical protein [Sporichthyaceae bacterium]
MRARPLTRVAGVALVLAGLLIAIAFAPGSAQAQTGWGGASFVDRLLAAEAGVAMSSPDAGLRPGEGSLAGSNTPSPPRCWYQPGYTAQDLVELINRIWQAARSEPEPMPSLIAAWRQDWLGRVSSRAGEAGLWFTTHCSDWSAIAVFRLANPDPFIWVPAAGPVPPVAGVVLTPGQLAQYARDSIVLPDTEVKLSPGARSTVNLDTWVWLDRTVFRPRHVRAQAGPLIVDAVANPSKLLLPLGLPAVLTPADGVCTDLFRAYEPGGDPACAITFGRSSAREPGLEFTADFALVWTVTWTSNWGPGGTLPDGQFTETTSIRVQELQTIVRRGG